ncbi:M-phase phosphoprotein 9 isoform X2 [Protopterus annectens]|uniref:M-phase phosphoprotein 9 isoform X2 n=1 Tax=Protopterus annectens TaxID=7888 RepID=UPI001CFB8E0E|nr:M-phase phosphoprotein 9 isoform X2 [Protopterus annectens]
MEKLESVRTGENGSQTATRSPGSISTEGNSAVFLTNEEISAGKCLPAVSPTSFETLHSLMQEIQSNGGVDPVVWKKCEVRWRQLFQLVEKQYQEQIHAQQEQYQCQIQLIQEEIKALMQLQSKSACELRSIQNSASRRPCIAASFASSQTCSSTPADDHSELTVRSSTQHVEPFILFDSQESRKQPKLFNAQQANSSSFTLSSGYGTTSAFNSDHTKPEFSSRTSEEPIIRHSASMSEEADLLESEHLRESLSSSLNLNIKRKGSLLLSCDDRPSLHSNDKTLNGVQSTEESPGVNLVKDNEKVSCLSGDQENTDRLLMSWAQKSKLKKQKSKSAQVVNLETGPNCNSTQGMEQGAAQQTTPEQFPATCGSSSHSFYLMNENDSPSSVMSEASGIAYWKLDENELYHALPQSIDNGLSSVFFQDGPKNKVKSDGVWPQPSLKDLYHKKQRENLNVVNWTSSSSQPSETRSPPEVWTLDPTLHMRPEQQNCEFRQYYLSSASGSRDTASPDSILGSSHRRSESDSLSHTNSLSESQSSMMLGDSSDKNGFHSEMCKNLPGSQYSQTSRSLFSGEHNTTQNSAVSQSEDADASSSTLTPPSPVRQPELPTRVLGLPDHGLHVSSFEDPLRMSMVRQNLKEKHARHLADLRAYYDAEIKSLKQQLETASRPAELIAMEKKYQNLKNRCEQLERALTEARRHIQEVENKNRVLEMQMADWPERYGALSTTAEALQQRVDELRTANKEKDNTISRLQSRLKSLEESFEKSYKLSDDKEAKMKQEQKMMQDLLSEYDSLGKEHERVKDSLNITENKVIDANTRILELKRTVSKLEAQIKQLEYENATKVRHGADSHKRASGSGLFHQPDVFQSPTKEPSSDVARRKWLISGAEYSIFTGQPLESNSNNVENNTQETCLPGRRYCSPSEKDCSPKEATPTKGVLKKGCETSYAPIMKALKDLDEAKANKNKRMQLAVQPSSDTEDSSNTFRTRHQTVGFADSQNHSPEKSKEVKSKRHSSCNSPRSSSLPPTSRKGTPTSTPTKREMMIAPVSVKSSPKRSPKENLSPGFSYLQSRDENTVTRFDVKLDDLDTVPLAGPRMGSPRKRLQFASIENSEAVNGAAVCRAAWEDRSVTFYNEKHSNILQTPYETELTYRARVDSLAETERLFDELTREKQQIEAALSRIPRSGGRMTLQARQEKEAMEDRLEKINHDLGLIRMTLKRFHILRTSANL